MDGDTWILRSELLKKKKKVSATHQTCTAGFATCFNHTKKLKIKKNQTADPYLTRIRPSGFDHSKWRERGALNYFKHRDPSYLVLCWYKKGAEKRNCTPWQIPAQQVEITAIICRKFLQKLQVCVFSSLAGLPASRRRSRVSVFSSWKANWLMHPNFPDCFLWTSHLICRAPSSLN